jgi:hypothetical protein
MKKIFLLSTAVLALAIATKAQRPNQDSLVKESAKTEVWEPVPKLVTPGNNSSDAPSDADCYF